MSEIKIQREWLERLLEKANKVYDIADNTWYFSDDDLKSSIILLLGYISSAKTILKNNK